MGCQKKHVINESAAGLRLKQQAYLGVTIQNVSKQFKVQLLNAMLNVRVDCMYAAHGDLFYTFSLNLKIMGVVKFQMKIE